MDKVDSNKFHHKEQLCCRHSVSTSAKTVFMWNCRCMKNMLLLRSKNLGTTRMTFRGRLLAGLNDQSTLLKRFTSLGIFEQAVALQNSKRRTGSFPNRCNDLRPWIRLLHNLVYFFWSQIEFLQPSPDRCIVRLK